MSKLICRYCKKELNTCMTDLGLAPLSNDYLDKENISKGQYTLPLKVYFCNNCKLTQVINYETPEGVFNSTYKYYSSFSTSWLKHSEKYVDYIVERLGLTQNSNVMEIASNDGYLLQYFKKYNIKPVGVEPSSSTAQVARNKGINTIESFFDLIFAKEYVNKYGKLDLIIGNNVLAHVPFIGDFVDGLKCALNENGTITMEFPHLLNLMKYNQFDTIYHEHFSYLSILAVKRIFEQKDLKIYDVQKLKTHGGSLRIFATHKNSRIEVKDSVRKVIEEELEYGLDDDKVYNKFNDNVKKIKFNIWKKLIDLKEQGKRIVGYGAAAKGNTLFNYCGIRNDVVDYVTDLSPYKQDLYLPGSLIPIVSPNKIKETKPDYVIIIPWNIKEEIINQLSFIREWGGKFLVLIPEIEEI